MTTAHYSVKNLFRPADQPEAWGIEPEALPCSKEALRATAQDVEDLGLAGECELVLDIAATMVYSSGRGLVEDCDQGWPPPQESVLPTATLDLQTTRR